MVNQVMPKPEFYLLLDGLLELEPGTITGSEKLIDISKWDSLAIIGFIALLDQHFSLAVPAQQIVNCRQIADLEKLTGGQVQ
jgi:acyl carrier protein